MKKRLIAVVVLLAGISACTDTNGNRTTNEGKVTKKELVLEKKYYSEETGLYLPEDLEATVWAESPMFFNPTNMDVDAKGRIWITEAVNYRLYRNDDEEFLTHPKGDRVVILEDKDGDGVAETSKVFVQDEDLTAPLGISVIGNKVIVSCSPSVIVYTDENGDDKADKKEIFLTGFSGKDHDHGLHAMVAGPDGKYYFTVGNAGPHIVTDKDGWTLRAGSLYNGGSPYMGDNEPGLISDDGKMWVGGMALRINPDGTDLTVLSDNFRNSYELAVDSYGNMWHNDNDDDGNRSVRVSWLMEGGHMGYFSADGSRTWKADRRPGQETVQAHWHQDDPGVIPFGDNTGAGAPTGVAFYESNLLGEKYRGMLLDADAGRNVVFAYRPKPKGAGYAFKRLNLVTSLKVGGGESAESPNNNKAKWFRPSDIVIGADGALYIADWYDGVVGGHRMIDTTGYGKIYRIAPKDKKLTTPKIDLENTQGQIAALLSPAVNVRNAGFVLLAAQGGKAVNDVKEVLNSNNPYHRARAIWLLSNMGPKGITEVEAMLKNKDPNLRMTAFQALRQVKTDIIPYAQQLSKDPSAAVRREVAIALRDLPLEKTQDIALTLASQYDGQDRFYLEAIGLMLTGKEEKIYPVLHAELGGDPLYWDDRFSGLAWRLHPVEAIPALEQRAGSAQLSEEERKKAFVALGFIKNQKAVDAVQRLASSNIEGVKEQALWWLRYRKTNEWSDFDIQVSEAPVAISPELRKKMLRYKEKLASNEFSMKEKANAAIAMAKDKNGGEMLLGLAAEKKLSKEIIAEVSKVIFDNPDQTVRVLASEYFKKPDSSTALSIPKITKMPGDAAKGKTVFESKCTTCHRIGKVGNDIGPELTAIGEKFGKSGLLDAIVNPSAGMAFGYEAWLITKKDGTSVSGFLQADGETVVLKGIGGDKVYNIKAADIAAREQFSTSIMPEPMALGLNEEDLANLSEYLLTMKTDGK